MTIRACTLGFVSVVAILLRAGAASSATKTVQVGPGGSLSFSPATLTVNVGDTVEWRWISGRHTTTRVGGPEAWDSGLASAPHTFSHTFTWPGSFPYVCTIHESLGMRGTIRVQSVPASSTTTVPTSETTTSTIAPFVPSCDTIEACLAQLLTELPNPATATNAKERRRARVLQRLARRASHQLERVSSTTGAAQAHAVARSRRTLQRLQEAADRAAAQAVLGVPVGPIDATIASLLALDQPG
jgi:plastocyanin